MPEQSDSRWWRRWAVWAVYKTSEDQVVREKLVKRPWHLFRFMAQSSANSLNRDPRILAKSIQVLAETGRGLWVDCEVRKARS